MRWSILLAASFLVAALPYSHAGDAPAPAANAEAEVLCLYDLSDMAMTSPPGFPVLALLRGEVTGEVNATFTPNTPRAEASMPTPTTTPTLDAVLAACFEPAIVDLLRTKSALRDGRLLLVTANAAMHRHIEHALATVRRRQNLQVNAHLTLYAMPPQHRQTRYALPGLKWRPLPGQPGAAIADLTPSEQAALIGSLTADREVATVTSPSVTVFAHQLASVTQIAQFPYPAAVFTPKGPELKTSTLMLGEGAEIRMTPTDDNAFIHLQLTQIRVTLLETKPVPWEGGDAKTRPVVPVTATTTIHIDQAIPNGHGVVVATDTFMLQDHDQPRAGFLVVDCRILDETFRGQQRNAFEQKKAELKAALSGAETKDAQKKESAPPVTKGADNF